MLLIAGFGDGGTNWGLVTSSLIPTARVCSFAQLGTGRSDPPRATQTFSSRAEDLQALLGKIGEVGPYVLVGHSFGGAQAVTFASMFPADVTGVVLVDATPPTWHEAICDVPDDGSDTARSLADGCAMESDPADNPERLDVAGSFSDVAKIDSLGDVPLVVVTAAAHPIPGLDPGEEARLDKVWTAGQEYWVSLSSAGQLIEVADAGHYIHLDKPEVVIDQIQVCSASSETTTSAKRCPCGKSTFEHGERPHTERRDRTTASRFRRHTPIENLSVVKRRFRPVLGRGGSVTGRLVGRWS